MKEICKHLKTINYVFHSYRQLKTFSNNFSISKITFIKSTYIISKSVLVITLNPKSGFIIYIIDIDISIIDFPNFNFAKIISSF